MSQTTYCMCERGRHYRITGESIKSAPGGAWPNSGEQKYWRCALSKFSIYTQCCYLLCPSHIAPLTRALMQPVLLINKQKVLVFLKWLPLSTIQGPCCFGDEIGKKHSYTCGHYHYVCRQHFSYKSCAECGGSGHLYDSEHSEEYPVKQTFWLDHSYSSIA